MPLDPHQLVPVGGHIFDRQGLDDIIARTLPQMPKDKTIMLGFGADLKGASVAVVFQKDTETFDWQARFAFSHTVAGDNILGLSGSVSR